MGDHPTGMHPSIRASSSQDSDGLGRASYQRQSEEKSLLKTFDEDPELSIRSGRFGPYLKYKGDNYKLPKGEDPAGLTYEACMKIIAETPAKTARKGGGRKTASTGKTTTRTRKAKS